MPAAAGAGGCCSLQTAFFDWQNEWVDQRYTEEGVLVACVVIFSQLRLPNCLRTGLLLLFGLVLQQSRAILVCILCLCSAFFCLWLKKLVYWSFFFAHPIVHSVHDVSINIVLSLFFYFQCPSLAWYSHMISNAVVACV